MDLQGIPCARLCEALGLPEGCLPEQAGPFIERWMVSIADREGKILMVARSFAAALGHTPEELVGGREESFASELHSNDFFREQWETLAAGETQDGVIVCRATDGSLHLFETTYRPVWSEEREILGYVAIRLELHPAECEAPIGLGWPRGVLDQISEGVILVEASPDLTIQYLNPALARLLRRHPSEWSGAPLAHLGGAFTEAATFVQIYEAVARGEHVRVEQLLASGDGTPLWCALSASPVLSEEGTLEALILLVTEIGERRGERLLRQFGDSMVRALDEPTAPEHLVTSLLQTIQEQLPRVALSVYTRTSRPGLWRGEAAIDTFGEACAPDPAFFRIEESAAWRRLLESDPVVFSRPMVESTLGDESELLRLLDTEGGWIAIRRGADGEPRMLMRLQLRGRSRLSEGERRFVRRAMRKLIETQERLEALALRETVDRKMRQSQKMEAIGTLASGIAHDFNNILGGIFGFLHLAKEDVAPDHPAQEWMAQIDKACGRARDLVQQVLTFSRSESTELAPLNPLSVMKDAVRLARASLPSSVEIYFEPPGVIMPEIEADPARLQLAILNLCTNAWQAMPHGRGTIQLGIGEVTKGAQSELSISVRDDGEGIEPEYLERVFEPFFSTRTVGQGTGLGLSVVHGIVQAHGGTVEVESTPGVGTTVSMRFPVVERIVAPVVEVADPMPRGDGQRIYYVDDEPPIVTWSRLVLERMGYEVETSTDPEIALADLSVRLNEFDLVVADLTMPRLTGVELIHRLQRMRPDLPAILVSGRGAVIGEAELGEAKPNLILQKPVGMADLAQALKAVLG